MPGALCPDGRTQLKKALPLALIVALAIVAYAMGLHRLLSPEMLVRYRAPVESFVTAHGVVALAAYVASYILVVILAVPGAVLLNLFGGLIFGGFIGGLLTVLSATTGAIIVFLLARSAFAEFWSRHSGNLVKKWAQGFRNDALSYILFLRLAMVFPFGAVNLAAALCNVRLMPFVTGTVLGILPGSFVIAFVGAGLDNLVSAHEAAFKACLAATQLECHVDFDARIAIQEMLVPLAALSLLALVPFAAKRLLTRY